MKLVSTVLAACLFATAVQAESLTFRIQSFHPNQVQIKFFSKYRPHVWPSAYEAYDLRDYDVHEYPITCISGEVVCYGAWVKGAGSTYWGVGHDGPSATPCTACCYTCNGASTVIKQLTVR